MTAVIILVCNACGELWKASGSPAICPACKVASFGITVERNANIQANNESKAPSKPEGLSQDSMGGGGSKMTIEDTVRIALNRYANDEIMLDAFFQWATNPTSMSAGYGLNENYPYIKKNLMGRHGLSSAETDKRVNELTKTCDAFINEARLLSIKEREQIGEVQRALQGILSRGDYEHVRRQGVLRRLREASEETRRAMLLFTLIEQVRASVSPDNFTNPTDYYSNFQSEFQAYYKSIFGDVAPILKVAREIVRSGAYNELYWLPSPHAKSSPRPTRVKAVVPSIAELEVLGTKLTPKPDVPSLLESFWEEGNFEILRFVDIVSHSPNGVITTDEPLPVGANILGFMGSHGKSVALSPLICADARQYIESTKDQKMEAPRQTLEKALVTVEQHGKLEGGLGVLWTGQGEAVWKFQTSPPLYVYLAPWLTTFTQTLAPSRVNFQEKPYVLFVIPCQSRASFFDALEKHSGFSLKDTHWEKSMGLLTNLEKPSEFRLLVGNRHPLLDNIFEEILKSSQSFVERRPINKADIFKKSIGGVASLEPAPVPMTPAPQPSPPTKGLHVLLGMRGSEKVFWSPATERSWNFVIVGSAGTGKTQTVQAVLQEFARQSIPYIVFDFRNDYVPIKSSSSKFGMVLDLGNISINPLELDGNNPPRDQKYQVSDIIDLVYTIGERQIGYIRDAIKLSYESKGIYEDDEASWKQVPPTFTDIQENLEHLAEEGGRTEKESIKGIFARLNPIFDYGIFSSKTIMPFEDLVKSRTVVNLGILPNDNLKAVVCEFLLRKLRYYLYGLPESREPRLFIIIDEAHRLKYEKSSSTGQLLKEARKYGVGLTLSTQDPVDFPDLVYNNIGGILSLQLTDPKYAKSIAEHLGGKVSWQSVKNELSDKFAAFVKFSSQSDEIKLKVIPYYEREH